MTPPIIPEPSKGIDAINFRNIKESRSFDIFSTFSEKEDNENLAITDNADMDPFANFSSGRLNDFDNEWNSLI